MYKRQLRFGNPVYYIDQVALGFTFNDAHVYLEGGTYDPSEPALAALIATGDPAAMPTSPSAGGGNASASSLRVLTRAQVLERFGVDTPTSLCVVFLVVFMLVCRLGAFVLLRVKLQQVLLSLNAVASRDGKGLADTAANDSRDSPPQASARLRVGHSARSPALLADDGAVAAASTMAVELAPAAKGPGEVV